MVTNLGLRVTLVTKDVLTPYSGMIPGYVAGHYDFEQAHIDLSKICGFSGVRLIHGEVNKIDYDNRTNGGRGGGFVYLKEEEEEEDFSKYKGVKRRGRGGIRFDILCIDVGSSPDLKNLKVIDDTAAENSNSDDPQHLITAVKPISTFSSRWDSLLETFQNPRNFTTAGRHSIRFPHIVVIVGSGAGGVELCLGE